MDIRDPKFAREVVDIQGPNKACTLILNCGHSISAGYRNGETISMRRHCHECAKLDFTAEQAVWAQSDDLCEKGFENSVLPQRIEGFLHNYMYCSAGFCTMDVVFERRQIYIATLKCSREHLLMLDKCERHQQGQHDGLLCVSLIICPRRMKLLHIEKVCSGPGQDGWHAPYLTKHNRHEVYFHEFLEAERVGH